MGAASRQITGPWSDTTTSLNTSRKAVFQQSVVQHVPIDYWLLARPVSTCAFVLPSSSLTTKYVQYHQRIYSMPKSKKSMKMCFPLNCCLSVAQVHLFACPHIFDIPRWSDLIPYITWLQGFLQSGHFFYLPLTNSKHSKRRTRSPVQLRKNYQNARPGRSKSGV